MNRMDFMTNHEWAFYGWKPGRGRHFFTPDVTNAVDVWQIGDFDTPRIQERYHLVVATRGPSDTWVVKKVSPSAMVHITEKPVELACRAMAYSSKPGQTVLDPFGGSGSTLIAAQKMNRRARLMEIDPRYCDVIVERYQQWCAANGVPPEVQREAA